MSWTAADYDSGLNVDERFNESQLTEKSGWSSPAVGLEIGAG